MPYSPPFAPSVQLDLADQHACRRVAVKRHVRHRAAGRRAAGTTPAVPRRGDASRSRPRRRTGSPAASQALPSTDSVAQDRALAGLARAVLASRCRRRAAHGGRHRLEAEPSVWIVPLSASGSAPRHRRRPSHERRCLARAPAAAVRRREIVGPAGQSRGSRTSSSRSRRRLSSTSRSRVSTGVHASQFTSHNGCARRAPCCSHRDAERSAPTAGCFASATSLLGGLRELACRRSPPSALRTGSRRMSSAPRTRRR